MKLIYFLEKELSVYREKDKLLILAPIDGQGENYNIDQLLYSFMQEVKYPLSRGKEKKTKANQKIIYLNVGPQDQYDKYLKQLKSNQVKHINEQSKGLLIGDSDLAGLVDNNWSDEHSVESEELITGNLDRQVKHLFIDLKSGARCKVYFLPINISTKEERIIYNANIFFNNVVKFVEKKYHIAVVNENLAGGIVYIHNKHARPGDNLYHKQFIFEGLVDLLKTEQKLHVKIEESFDITENFEGGFTKCPIRLVKE